MKVQLTSEQEAIREGVAAVCSRFGDDYWLRKDREKKFPFEFVQAMVDAGWTGATLPVEYGGAGLGMREAALILYEIKRTGGAAAATAVHVNIFGPHPVVRFGSEELKRRTLPRLIRGEDRTCFAVTEPDAGTSTTDIKTFARREGDRYIVNGRKVWISTAQVANKILLVTRTAPKSEGKKPTDGITLFYTDLDRSRIDVREIEKMGRNAVDSNELFIDNLEVPVEDRIGEEGKGFKYLLHGLNAERIVVAAGLLGGTRSVLDRAVKYAKERVVFGRPIGMNQAVQHPLAEIWARLTAAELTVWAAATLYDQDMPCAAEVNAGKFLAGELFFDACTRAVRVHGGYGQAKEYHVERYFRESVSPLVGPVSQELALCHIAEQMLGLPKSY
ncbi:MAG: acyl-CoA/acyl-ACP dehydrogenase [Comamonadaceae bacterium]|nr:acyl-CoA/acyl-ACP dehydrogenase [Comamonadaceae bacterium]